MKKVTLTYWITTSLLSLMMIFSASMYLGSEQIKEAFAHIGFPQYFRVELAMLKLLGVIALLVPVVPGRVKEWGYFGFFVTFVSAFIAHAATGDAASVLLGPVVALLLLMASYFSYRSLNARTAVA